MKVAVITPYYREGLEALSKCHESVRNQTHPATHLMVADGFPVDEVSEWDVEHMVLPHPHGDYGNTPRGLGAISALNQGFDAFAFLDADNWYAEDHIASLVELCRERNCDVAFAGRFIVLPDGYVVPQLDPADQAHKHVDTSCFFITARAAFLLPIWAMMDRSLSRMGDQAMFRVVQGRGVSHAWSGRRTVYYRSDYHAHFRLAGREPPSSSRTLTWDDVWRDMSHERSFERLGFSFSLHRAPGQPW